MTELLLNEEEMMLRNLVREFADAELAPRAADYDQSDEFPYDNIRGLAQLGILGMGIDEEYGGSGGTTRQMAVAVEEIARGCAATATILGAHLSLCAQYIAMFGAEGQKREFIPRWSPARRSALSLSPSRARAPTPPPSVPPRPAPTAGTS